MREVDTPLCGHCGDQWATGEFRITRLRDGVKTTKTLALCDECEAWHRDSEEVTDLHDTCDDSAAAEDAHWERLIQEERES